jgi:hypothetical protein
MAHLRGSGFCECDGYHFAWIIHFGQQAQKTACEQVGFA